MANCGSRATHYCMPSAPIASFKISIIESYSSGTRRPAKARSSFSSNGTARIARLASLVSLAWLLVEASVLGCRLMRVLIARHLSFASHISGSDGALVEGLQQQAELN